LPQGFRAENRTDLSLSVLSATIQSDLVYPNLPSSPKTQSLQPQHELLPFIGHQVLSSLARRWRIVSDKVDMLKIAMFL
jgi:hypothetical protein